MDSSRRLPVAVLVLAALLAGACAPRRVAVSMAGSTAFQPVADVLADAFMASHPGVSVTVQVGGSAAGIQAALSGAAQIGVADQGAAPQRKGLDATEVARDGIAVIVNPANAVTNLTREQIRGMYTGSITNWQQVGGVNRSISLVCRERGSGTRASFEQLLAVSLMAGNPLVEESNGAMRQTVANDPDALGYLSHSGLDKGVKAVSVDGVACAPGEILAGRYTLVHSIFLLTKGPAQGSVRDFIEFVLSPSGQSLIAGHGLLPVEPASGNSSPASD